MKKFKILRSIMRRTKADEILSGFLIYTLITSLLIWLSEPGITSYSDALWYCYSVISTAGFGDVTVVTIFAKALSVLLTVYSILTIAIITGVVVNYYSEIVEAKKRETATMFLNQLERLPELSREELETLSNEVKKFNKK